ncbi:hypothetical protein FOZ63_032360 [Perkinsus olseni]|uniref:Uncharacterized protein n=1 Tax=Perkinsus olseni TaxID=32597 RepID=A0A7J6R5Q3_PEROL|nr:hypothetical protein FOZ62_024785 [Perkinsus olseni]KAF4723239.1 hypothetical protein FOZ63_032360 [Perkinsus olseni]
MTLTRALKGLLSCALIIPNYGGVLHNSETLSSLMGNMYGGLLGHSIEVMYDFRFTNGESAVYIAVSRSPAYEGLEAVIRGDGPRLSVDFGDRYQDFVRGLQEKFPELRLADGDFKRITILRADEILIPVEGRQVEMLREEFDSEDEEGASSTDGDD